MLYENHTLTLLKFFLVWQIHHFPKLLVDSLLEKDGVVQKIDGQPLRQRREQGGLRVRNPCSGNGGQQFPDGSLP